MPEEFHAYRILVSLQGCMKCQISHCIFFAAGQQSDKKEYNIKIKEVISHTSWYHDISADISWERENAISIYLIIVLHLSNGHREFRHSPAQHVEKSIEKGRK